jgi:hypothetical protein
MVASAATSWACMAISGAHDCSQRRVWVGQPSHSRPRLAARGAATRPVLPGPPAPRDHHASHGRQGTRHDRCQCTFSRTLPASRHPSSSRDDSGLRAELLRLRILRTGVGRIQVVSTVRTTRDSCLLSQPALPTHASDTASMLRWLCRTGHLTAIVRGNAPVRKDVTCTSWRTRWGGVGRGDATDE